jgi:hypothetical protein
MQRYRLPLVREVPIPSDEEARLPQPIAYYYLASDADAHIAELEKAERRYEKLRRLSPREFHSLWMQSIAGDRFDDLVDRLPS